MSSAGTRDRQCTRPEDLVIAERVECRLLAVFWWAIRQGNDRLSLLLDYTAIEIHRSQSWNPARVRAQHENRHSLEAAVSIDKRACFSCGTSGQLYAHHIIEIQHGGSNAIRNQVALCFDCHQYLHPWLTEADRLETSRARAFESLGEVISRVAPGALGVAEGDR